MCEQNDAHKHILSSYKAAIIQYKAFEGSPTKCLLNLNYFLKICMHKAHQSPFVFKMYYRIKLLCLAVNQHYMSDSVRNHWAHCLDFSQV